MNTNDKLTIDYIINFIQLIFINNNKILKELLNFDKILEYSKIVHTNRDIFTVANKCSHGRFPNKTRNKINCRLIYLGGNYRKCGDSIRNIN